MTQPGKAQAEAPAVPAWPAGWRAWSAAEGPPPSDLFLKHHGVWAEASVKTASWFPWLARLNPAAALVLTTASAQTRGLSLAIARAASERLSLSQDLRERIETALHEGVTNAVMHGNLGIGSEGRTDTDGYAFHAVLAAARSANASYALKPLAIGLRLDGPTFEFFVRDDGAGFSPAESPPDHTGIALTKPHGRGLHTIRAMCDGVELAEGGRLIAMRFRP